MVNSVLMMLASGVPERFLKWLNQSISFLPQIYSEFSKRWGFSVCDLVDSFFVINIIVVVGCWYLRYFNQLQSPARPLEFGGELSLLTGGC